MSKHTPGPWVINAGIDIWCLNPRRFVATTIDKGPASEADAKLIAAAPEMLKALRLAALFIESLPYGQKQEHRIIWDAIAKAEGRS